MRVRRDLAAVRRAVHWSLERLAVESKASSARGLWLRRSELFRAALPSREDLSEQPIRMGDWIRLGDVFGPVNAIGIRAIRVRAISIGDRLTEGSPALRTPH